MKKRAIATLFTLFILIFTTGGCTITPKYQVTIDAITAPNTTLQPSTYELKALDKNKNSNSLRFQQYATPLAQILHEKGYLKVTGAERPQQTIYFDYGIEKLKEERRTYVEPDITFGFGFGYPYGVFGYYDPFYHHHIYYGSRYHTYTSTYYNRYITILAKDHQSDKELWRVDVSSVGESKNLRKIIPLLIEASKPYIGTTTKEPVELVIKAEKEEKR